MSWHALTSLLHVNRTVVLTLSMSGAQYWTMLYKYQIIYLWRFWSLYFLIFIVNMAPVCLLLPYKYHVCTLLNLNMNFSMINY